MATKKITAAKKVEAPIDNRETFVSLQKSFADSEMSVEEKLKTSISFRPQIQRLTRSSSSVVPFPQR